MRIFFLSLFFLQFISTKAQVGGESVFQFLNVSTSARQVALGGEVLTFMNNVNQPIWNPATINPELDNKLSVNYTNYLSGINVGSIAYAKIISRRFGTIHGSIKYLNYGTLIGADEFGNETGSFKARDVAISVGYAYNFLWTSIYIGANLKLINATIGNFSSIGIASDIAILYYSPNKPFTFTLVARNIGTQIKSFNQEAEKLPFKIAFGGAYQLKYVPLKWYITFDNIQKWNLSAPNPSNQIVDLEGNVTNDTVSFLGNMFRHISVGAELFSESSFNLRVGYNFKRAKELALQNVRSFSGISFGFGIKMNRMKLNYSYSKIHTATNISTFSLQINLDKK